MTPWQHYCRGPMTAPPACCCMCRRSTAQHGCWHLRGATALNRPRCVAPDWGLLLRSRALCAFACGLWRGGAFNPSVARCSHLFKLHDLNPKLLPHNCCCRVQVYKEEGRAFAMLAFASPADRSSFVSGFRAGQQHPNAANSEMLLLLPGQAVPEEAVAAMNSNNKRKHGPEQPPRKVGLCVCVCRQHRQETVNSGFGPFHEACRISKPAAAAAAGLLLPAAPYPPFQLRIPHTTECYVHVLCPPAGMAQAAAAGNDRQKRGDQQQRGGHKQQQQQQGPRDIRGVVCPWWDRPYHEQLADKMGAVTGALRQMAEEVGGVFLLWLVRGRGYRAV